MPSIVMQAHKDFRFAFYSSFENIPTSLLVVMDIKVHVFQVIARIIQFTTYGVIILLFIKGRRK